MMDITIELTRKDLLFGWKDVPFSGILIHEFNLSTDLILRASLITFTDDDGSVKVLKDRHAKLKVNG